jgi:hypothetical protein
MSTLTTGDRRTLRGPSTRVSACTLNAAGEISATTELYTEYHQADAGGAPVYVVGKTLDGKADLLATGVRDQVELAAACEAAKAGEVGEVKPPVEEPVDGGEVARVR